MDGKSKKTVQDLIEEKWPTDDIILSREKLYSLLEQMYELPRVKKQYQRLFDSGNYQCDYTKYFEDIQNSLMYLAMVSSNGYIERILNHAIQQDILRYSPGLYSMYIKKDITGGANPNQDRIKGIIKSISNEASSEYQSFLDESHSFTKFNPGMRNAVIPENNSMRNRDLFDNYLSKFRNHVAHSRNLHEYDMAVASKFENIVMMVEFSINLGDFLENKLNPNNKWILSESGKYEKIY